MGQRAAIYCRVSTADQCCDRQERELREFAERAGYEVAGVFRETGSGAKLDRVERKAVMDLAQARLAWFPARSMSSPRLRSGRHATCDRLSTTADSS